MHTQGIGRAVENTIMQPSSCYILHLPLKENILVLLLKQTCVYNIVVNEIIFTH